MLGVPGVEEADEELVGVIDCGWVVGVSCAELL
jgi:hypothetical protein